MLSVSFVIFLCEELRTMEIELWALAKNQPNDLADVKENDKIFKTH